MTQGLSPNAFDWMRAAATESDPLDANAANLEALEEANANALEFAFMVNNVLGDGDGMVLMHHLRELTIEMPLMDVTGSLVTGEVSLSPSEWAYVREGQNSIVRYLEAQIRLAKNPPKTEEPTEPKQESEE